MKYIVYIPKTNTVEVFDTSIRTDRYNMFQYMLNNYEGNDTFRIYRAVKELEPVYWTARSIHGQVVEIDLGDRYGFIYCTVSIRDGEE